MTERKIVLTIEGLESEGGHVRFQDFLKWLDLNRKTLTAFDRLIARGHRASYFRITNLSHGSPATVELEPRATDPKNDLTSALVERYNGALRSIGEGIVPTELGIDVLKNLRDMAVPVGRTVYRARIKVGEAEDVDLTEKFAKTVDTALKEVEYGQGTVEGAVERFNSHRGANVFFIYPDFGPTKVACHFPENLKKKAAEAVTKRVRVSGRLSYLRGVQFPHEMHVGDIEIFPPEHELPTMEDLRGISPDLTGDALSEDFLAEERDEWDD